MDIALTKTSTLFHISHDCPRWVTRLDGKTNATLTHVEPAIVVSMCASEQCAEGWRTITDDIVAVYDKVVAGIDTEKWRTHLPSKVATATHIHKRCEIVGIDLPPVPEVDLPRWAGQAIQGLYRQSRLREPSLREALVDTIRPTGYGPTPSYVTGANNDALAELIMGVDETALLTVKYVRNWFLKPHRDWFESGIVSVSPTRIGATASFDMVAMWAGLTSDNLTVEVPLPMALFAIDVSGPMASTRLFGGDHTWAAAEVTPLGPLGEAFKALIHPLAVSRHTSQLSRQNRTRLFYTDSMETSTTPPPIWDAARAVAGY